MPLVGTFGRVEGEVGGKELGLVLGNWFWGIAWWSPPEQRELVEGAVEKCLGCLSLEGMGMDADRESGAPKSYG